MKAILGVILALMLWCTGSYPVMAQAAGDPRFPPAARYRPDPDIVFRVANATSEGVRLHVELFSRDGVTGQKLPTVIMAHGWGGTAAAFRRDANDLARAGYLVVLFDYRGWGESDGRLVLANPNPAAGGTEPFTAQVQPLRGYVDPWEQVEDWFNVIDWVAGEPTADMDHLGLRGSSYSGGHVVYVAARDRRVKAIVSQVGGIAPRPDPNAATGPFAAAARERATRMARGEIGYPAPGAQEIGNLRGAPVGDKLLRWWPNDEAQYLTIPALFIVAGNEELFQNSNNAERAFARAKGPKDYVTIPGIHHYGIYSEARAEAMRLAINWFDRYLKQ